MRRLLERVRDGGAYDPRRVHAAPANPGARKSPTAHWRHYVRGPVFDAHPERREMMEGVGWCVRVRVDPDRWS